MRHTGNCSHGIHEYEHEFVEPFVELLVRYQDVPVVVILEPDSLPNLVTNMGFQGCTDTTAAAYKQGLSAAVRYLHLRAPTVAVYLDAAHGGWLGWDEKVIKLVDLVGELGIAKHLRGFCACASLLYTASPRPRCPLPCHDLLAAAGYEKPLSPPPQLPPPLPRFLIGSTCSHLPQPMHSNKCCGLQPSRRRIHVSTRSLDANAAPSWFSTVLHGLCALLSKLWWVASSPNVAVDPTYGSLLSLAHISSSVQSVLLLRRAAHTTPVVWYTTKWATPWETQASQSYCTPRCLAMCHPTIFHYTYPALLHLTPLHPNHRVLTGITLPLSPNTLFTSLDVAKACCGASSVATTLYH